jgi:hypothetical protein
MYCTYEARCTTDLGTYSRTYVDIYDTYSIIIVFQIRNDSVPVFVLDYQQFKMWVSNCLGSVLIPHTVHSDHDES